MLPPGEGMPLAALDLGGTKGAGRRKLDDVPGAFRRAFDPDSGEDERGRAAAAEAVRAAVSGEEGAFTTAGARVLAAAIDGLLGAEVAAPERLAELALDLAYGDQRVTFARVEGATSPAARAVRGAVVERLPALRAGLRAGRPEARGLAAWLLLSAGAVDDAVVDALATEADLGVRAALLVALAAHPGVDRAVLRAAMSPPADPAEHAAAAAAWWALDGDAAPDAVVLTLFLARHDDRPGPGFPWRAGPGRVGFARVLAAEGRGRALACGWLLRELEATFDRGALDRVEAGRAFGELQQILAAVLPQPPDPAAASPLARRAVAVTTRRWFLGRRDFGGLGLPDTVPGRRAWLGAEDDAPTTPLAVVDRWADAVEGVVAGPGPTEEEARAALASCDAESRAGWARAWLARRRPWPGASRSPNGSPTLLALEQLAPQALDALWCRDHEPVLSALSVADARAVALLARVPPGRRPAVWRAWVGLHPNPAVAYRHGLAAAQACPTPEVATALVALALAAGPAEPLDGLAAALDAMGEAGRAARERLAAVGRAAG
jgi:hypothetical protein